MSHFSRHCLSVFAYCLFGCLVVFCSHALSLVIACAVWCSAGKSFRLLFTVRFPLPFTMSHFSRRCLRVFAFGCFFVRLVVFCSHALSLVIACAVWCSAGKSFRLLFTVRFPLPFTMSHFSRRCVMFCIWLLFCASCGVSSARFTICAVWCSAEKSVPFIFTALFLLVLRCNAFYK